MFMPNIQIFEEFYLGGGRGGGVYNYQMYLMTIVLYTTTTTSTIVVLLIKRTYEDQASDRVDDPGGPGVHHRKGGRDAQQPHQRGVEYQPFNVWLGINVCGISSGVSDVLYIGGQYNNRNKIDRSLPINW
jgi:hypothetical protein